MKKFSICLMIIFLLVSCGNILTLKSEAEDVQNGVWDWYKPPAKKPSYKKKSSSSSSSSNVHYHNNNNKCSATHCSHRWCSCGSGASHNCGGGCTWGEWQLYNGTQHAKLCTRGCSRTNGLHNASWNNWSTNHTITCKYSGCTLGGSHSAKWATSYTINSAGNHEQKCTNTYITLMGGKKVSINTGKSCAARNDVHSPEFTADYYKLNGNVEGDGTSTHKRECQHGNCTRTETHSPTWGEWTSISDDEHKRECIYGAGCELTQTLKHNKIYTPIEGDIHHHTVTCNGDDGKTCPYQAIKEHVDSYPRDGQCDQCHAKLYEITQEPVPTQLTNENVTVTVTMYDVAKKEDIVKSHVYTKNNLNELHEERYEFVFDGIDSDIRPVVDHINKTVSGRIKYEPNKPTADPVKITFLPDYEEETYGDYDRDEYFDRSKQIYARILIDGQPRGDWQLAEDINKNPTITYTFDENGYCEIELYDTVGNGNQDGAEGKQSIRIPVMVDWIVSGQATVATTSDVLENGTIFTDILISVDKEWSITNAQNQISVKLYKILSDGSITEVTHATEKNKMVNGNIVRVSKLEVKDYNENRITESSIGRGLYYIKVGIGGAGVFTIDPEQDSTRYILEITEVQPDSSNSSITINGKNRIEVTVNKLNDLT